MGLGWTGLAAAAAVQAAPAPAERQPPPDPAAAIIVTGERIARTVRETASSVIVLGEREIEASGADRVEQLLSALPNVQLGNGSQGPAIRGQDTTGPLQALPAFLGGNRPRTTLIVDGRPATYNEFVFGTAPVWDVDRIEVFRSPQTTTQGQNSIAGAIFVHSNEPSFDAQRRARAIAGDYQTRQISAVASGPLSDSAAVRVAGDLRYARTTSRIDDVMAGADPNHDVYGLLRAKLLLTPRALPGTRATLTYAHTQSQAPQVVGVSAPFRERRDRDVSYGLFRIRADSLTATLRQQISEELRADLLLTGGDSRARRFAIAGFGETINDGRDWSAEAILNWTPDGQVRLVGGFSRAHVALKQFINLSLLSGSIGRFRDWQDGTGLFADVSFLPAPRLTLSGGMRYQRDRQERRGALTADSFNIPVDFVGTFDAWLPKLSLAYDVSPELRVGALFQRSYNPGGTTIRIDTSRADEFAAESLWDYELFARGSALGGAFGFEANLFYYDMRNAQRAQSIIVVAPSGRRAGFANLFNVPKARSYGAEAQLSWRADRLKARAAVGLLRTRMVDADSESAHLDGKEFDRSPHFTGSVAIDWAPRERLRLSALVRHHSAYFANPQNLPETRVDSGTSVDARAEYRVGAVSLFAQVRNVLNAFNLVDLDAADSGEAEDPRRISVGLESRF